MGILESKRSEFQSLLFDFLAVWILKLPYLSEISFSSMNKDNGMFLRRLLGTFSQDNSAC